MVADRVATRSVGSPSTGADGLERLRDAAGAQEVLITTTTHRHGDRVTSHELLAEKWARR